MTSEPRRRWTALCLAAASLAVATGLAMAQEGRDAAKARAKAKSKTKAATSTARATGERASGVIIKVEPVTKGADPGSTISEEAKEGRQAPRSLRLTINTAVVWRDWARDQPSEAASDTPKKDAEEGANSVATKGQPAVPDSEVLIDVGPDTRVVTLFRSPADEASKGAPTPAAAAEDEDPAADSSASKTKAKGEAKSKAGAPQFTVKDLKPGLFVEVDYRHLPAQNPASVVAVIRPVRESSPAAGGSEPSKKGRTKGR